MGRIPAGLALVVVVAMMVVSIGRAASADDSKMVGIITKISIAGKNATAAEVTLKDNKTGKLVTITVNDKMTLERFKDQRIDEGDEIRCKYETRGGKNLSVSFRSTSGC